MELTEEQKKMLQSIVMGNGMTAWEYIESQNEADRPWVIDGILSLMKKGRMINRLTLFWEIEDLRNPPETHERPMCQHAPSKELQEKLTEEQLQQIQGLTLSNGMSAWSYVLSWPDDGQYWIALGILSCVRHGYGLTGLEINWEARDLRRAK